MKKREKFKLKGLQANSIDKQGVMESMSIAHNLRIDEYSMITTVCENRMEAIITKNYDYTIKFCHTFVGKENYIALKGNEVHWVDIVNGEIFSKAILYNYSNIEFSDVTFDFFTYGNTLYITVKHNSEPVDEKVVHWEMDKYVSRDIDDLEPPRPSNITCKYLCSTEPESLIPSLVMSVEIERTSSELSGLYVVTKYNYLYKEHIDRFIKLNYIHGTVYLIFAYKLIDGSIVKHSGVYMIDNQRIKQNPKREIYIHDGIHTISFHMDMMGIIPTITFDLPQSILDNPLIESIVVYSTRNNIFYDYDNIYQTLNFSDADQVDIHLQGKDYIRISAKSIVDTTFAKVAHMPFYEVADIKFREESFLELNFSDHYNNIEQYPVFKPNLSLHKMIGKSKYEYNSRLHLLGVNMEFFSGEIIPPHIPFIINDDASYSRNSVISGTLIYKTTLEDNNEILTCYAKLPTHVYHSSINNSIYILFPNMITYPDIRAKKIETYYQDHNGIVHFLKGFTLKKAPENGLAYYQDLSTEKVNKYHACIIDNIVTENFGPAHNMTTFNNRITVSHINNGYVFEYSSVIDISNRNTVINGVDTIYHDFTEIQFGLYPLYVFTNQGIFALESNDATVVYSNIVPINNQITDIYFHSVSAGGIVFFLTQRGIHILVGTTCKYISGNIEKHKHADIPFSDYLQNCKLIYVPYYEEIIITNSLYSYCYLYSIQKEEFTTRDFEYVQISKDKIVNSNGVYSLFYAENKTVPLFSFLESNAEMFGVMDRKRVRDFELSGEFNRDARLVLLGSNNGMQWSEIKSIDACDKRFKKCSGSWRYLKYSLQSSYIELDAVEVEIESRGL